MDTSMMPQQDREQIDQASNEADTKAWEDSPEIPLSDSEVEHLVQIATQEKRQ